METISETLARHNRARARWHAAIELTLAFVALGGFVAVVLAIIIQATNGN